MFTSASRAASESTSAAPSKHANDSNRAAGRLWSWLALGGAADHSRAHSTPHSTPLSVSRADDPREHEAEAVAKHTVPAATSMGGGSLDAGAPPAVTPAVSARLAGSAGRGVPLPDSERAFFEPRLAHRFDDVRVHSDGEAARLSDALGAQAFTYGRDVYLGAGRHASPSSSDRRLLAHELAHVAQQSVAGAGAAIHRQPDPNVDYFPHKTLAKKINALLIAKQVDTVALFEALEGLGRDPGKVTKLEEAYKSLFKKELAADLAAVLTGDDLARATFLLYGPPIGSAHADVTVDKPGTNKHTAKVAGGEVSLHTGVEYSHPDKTKTTEGFSIGYEGAQSKEARFIQFLWSEVIASWPNKPAGPVDEVAASVSGNVELTTDSRKPKRIVDSGMSKSPFYEQPGPDVRTDKSTTIFDRPSASQKVIDATFDKGATQVIERDHFDDYLIVEYKAVYRVSLIVEWTFTSKTAVTRKTDFDSGGAVTSLPADVKAALIKRYPKFDFIQ